MASTDEELEEGLLAAAFGPPQPVPKRKASAKRKAGQTPEPVVEPAARRRLTSKTPEDQQSYAHQAIAKMRAAARASAKMRAFPKGKARAKVKGKATAKVKSKAKARGASRKLATPKPDADRDSDDMIVVDLAPASMPKRRAVGRTKRVRKAPRRRQGTSTKPQRAPRVAKQKRQLKSAPSSPAIRPTNSTLMTMLENLGHVGEELLHVCTHQYPQHNHH